MSLTYEMLCSELHLPMQKCLSDYAKYDVDLEDYRSVIRFIKFVQKYNITAFKYVNEETLDELFGWGLDGADAFVRGYTSTIYDHARIVIDALGFHYLILQPYMSTAECREILEGSKIASKYKILGQDESFHCPDKTSLIIIYEDRVSFSKRITEALGL